MYRDDRFDMPQGCAAWISVVGLGRPGPGSGNDDDQDVAAGPTRTIHNLLDDRGNIRCSLVGAGLADNAPGGW